MNWEEFADKVVNDDNITNRKINKYISKLNNIGPSTEVLDLGYNMTEENYTLLIKKCIECGVIFTREEVIELWTYLDYKYYLDFVIYHLSNGVELSEDDIVEIIKHYPRYKDYYTNLFIYASSHGMIFTREHIKELAGYLEDEFYYNIVLDIMKTDQPYNGEELVDIFVSFVEGRELMLRIINDVDQADNVFHADDIMKLSYYVSSDFLKNMIMNYLNRGGRFSNDELSKLSCSFRDKDVSFLLNEINYSEVESFEEIVQLAGDGNDEIASEFVVNGINKGLPISGNQVRDVIFKVPDKVRNDLINYSINANVIFTGDEVESIGLYLQEESLYRLFEYVIRQNIKLTSNNIIIYFRKKDRELSEMLVDYAIDNQVEFTDKAIHYLQYDMDRKLYKKLKRNVPIVKDESEEQVDISFVDVLLSIIDSIDVEPVERPKAEKSKKKDAYKELADMYRNNLYVKNIVGKEMYDRDILGTRIYGEDSFINNVKRADEAIRFIDYMYERKNK